MLARDIRNRKMAGGIFIVIAVLGFISGNSLLAKGPAAPIPAYGTGAIQVRFYTDYFCPPCLAMEPAVEPVLRNLLKKKIITLTMIDVPLHRHSPLFAQYFIYALKGKNDLDQALKVRHILFEAAASTHVTTREQLEEVLQSKGIPYEIFDHQPYFNRYNDLIKEDRISSTPTCVIIKGDKKEAFGGRQDILKALKNLQ
jgi:thiol-disulfide isomerase/thioredoxin